MGIDVGTSAIKIALIDNPYPGKGPPEIVYLTLERIRKRDPEKVIRECYEQALSHTGLKEADIAYLASTGEGELVKFRRGHFYGMTTHARGAHFLLPGTRTIIDIGALHARAIRIDRHSRVLQYKMTGQCASGSGQFLENIARYLGVSLEEIGPLSLQSRNPEMVSSICAVLAETDVINMVSRGISTSDILKGIHQSIANRLVQLLRAINAESPVTLTGGLANDVGLQQALRERLASDRWEMEITAHPYSVYAGAIGAALWAGFRHLKLATT
jgi:benzoyl-CoA reductase subunit D